MRLSLTSAALSLFLVGALHAADAAPAVAPKAYPLKTCIVSNEDLGEMGAPVVKVYEGQEIKFCCKGCVKKFDKDPAKFVADMNAKVAAAAAKPAADPTAVPAPAKP